MGKAIPTKGVKERLNDLERYFPGQHEVIYSFGKMLSGRLADELEPGGFILAAQLAIYDLQEGVDGFSGERLRGPLIGLPSVVYRSLDIALPSIIRAVCPKRFAEAAIEFYKKAQQR